MASAARLAPAASSEASSSVKLGSWADHRHHHAHHHLQRRRISGLHLLMFMLALPFAVGEGEILFTKPAAPEYSCQSLEPTVLDVIREGSVAPQSPTCPSTRQENNCHKGAVWSATSGADPQPAAAIRRRICELTATTIAKGVKFLFERGPVNNGSGPGIGESDGGFF